MSFVSGQPQWFQKVISLPARSRGCHLVTKDVLNANDETENYQLPELGSFKVGMANIFLQHTSAALTINENFVDMEMMLNRIAPENAPYCHTVRPDDMPGHVKSSLFGVCLNIPISNGSLALGQWQGIWLCEARNQGGSRKCVITLQGITKN
ncbi:hypothetical protein DFS34DRAFT_609082 [Phlyctochytrium arcticum]|nr:hypothetical protein DFS34DRAFT_609082 [Phlyctochytrium arcticum]